jgi:hypothetical protein
MTITREIDGRTHEIELTRDELEKSFTESLAIVYRNTVEFSYEGMDDLQAWRNASMDNADAYDECIDDCVDEMVYEFEKYDMLYDYDGITGEAYNALENHGIIDAIENEEVA